MRFSFASSLLSLLPRVRFLVVPPRYLFVALISTIPFLHLFPFRLPSLRVRLPAALIVYRWTLPMCNLLAAGILLSLLATLPVTNRYTLVMLLPGLILISPHSQFFFSVLCVSSLSFSLHLFYSLIFLLRPSFPPLPWRQLHFLTLHSNLLFHVSCSACSAPPLPVPVVPRLRCIPLSSGPIATHALSQRVVPQAALCRLLRLPLRRPQLVPFLSVLKLSQFAVPAGRR